MRKIRWLNKADTQFSRQLDFIKTQSVQNAESVATEILRIIKSIPDNPERFGLDKYKMNNDGSFRYFEKHRLRFAFQIRTNEIIILRCRHTSMQEKNH